jgi:hypothetical protein
MEVDPGSPIVSGKSRHQLLWVAISNCRTSFILPFVVRLLVSW